MSERATHCRHQWLPDMLPIPVSQKRHHVLSPTTTRVTWACPNFLAFWTVITIWIFTIKVTPVRWSRVRILEGAPKFNIILLTSYKTDRFVINFVDTVKCYTSCKPTRRAGGMWRAAWEDIANQSFSRTRPQQFCHYPFFISATPSGNDELTHRNPRFDAVVSMEFWLRAAQR